MILYHSSSLTLLISWHTSKFLSFMANFCNSENQNGGTINESSTFLSLIMKLNVNIMNWLHFTIIINSCFWSRFLAEKNFIGIFVQAKLFFLIYITNYLNSLSPRYSWNISTYCVVPNNNYCFGLSVRLSYIPFVNLKREGPPQVWCKQDFWFHRRIVLKQWWMDNKWCQKKI